MQKSKPKTSKAKPAAEERTKPNAPVLVKLGVGFLVLAVTSWSLPTAGTGVDNGSQAPRGSEWLLYVNDRWIKTSPIKPVVLSLGLWQSWDMFSPNPANVDMWSDAEVHFRDGSQVRYQYPRMYLLSTPEKYARERYRKFFEHAYSEEFLWPYYARAIAYHFRNPKNPPTRIVLHRHWYVIPPATSFGDYSANLLAALRSGTLNEKTLLPDNPAVPTAYNDQAYYDYTVTNEDL